jgi:hypothetical protein
MAAVQKFWRKRMIGVWASWAAAYALVINVVLSSAFLATLPPVAPAAGHEICFASVALGAPNNDAGQPIKKSAFHCPICVGNHIAAAPPPSASALHIRVAIAIAPDFALSTGFIARAHAQDHQARAPPRLT